MRRLLVRNAKGVTSESGAAWRRPVDVDNGLLLPKRFGDGSPGSLSFFSAGGDSSTGRLI